jgi:hypothetical protein
VSGEVASAPGESRKAVVEGYEYDLFLSYGREGDVGEWVRNHFHDRLRNCLSSEFPRPVRIFFDVEQEPGTHWRKNIARALQRSHLCGHAVAAVLHLTLVPRGVEHDPTA